MVDENQTPVSVIPNTILSRRYFLCDEGVTSPKEPRSQHIDEGRHLCSTKEFETWGASDWQAPEYILGELMLLYMIHLLRYFRISRFCVIYQISAVQLRSCLSNFYFQCLPEENIFKDPAT